MTMPDRTGDRWRKHLAGTTLMGSIIDRGGSVPRDEIGDLTLEAGYRVKAAWAGFLNGNGCLRKNGEFVEITDAGRSEYQKAVDADFPEMKVNKKKEKTS